MVLKGLILMLSVIKGNKPAYFLCEDQAYTCQLYMT